MNAGTGRPTKAQAAQRTELLLDCARSLFSSRGFAAATIDEIAARLRWSKHTVYHRYSSKLALLEAVVERDVGRFRMALIDAGMSGADPLAALRAMALAYFDFSSSPGYSALYAAVALEAATSPHLRQRLSEWSAASLAPLHDAIRAIDAPDIWLVEDIEEVCAILVDLLDGEANRVKWSASGDTSRAEKMFERRWQLFCHATLRDDRGPQPF